MHILTSNPHALSSVLNNMTIPSTEEETEVQREHHFWLKSSVKLLLSVVQERPDLGRLKRKQTIDSKMPKKTRH